MTHYIRVFKSRLDAKSEGWFRNPSKAINKLISLLHDLPDDQIVRLQITFSNAKRYNLDMPAGVLKAYSLWDKTIYLVNHITRFIEQQQREDTA
jgi:hypothetical protein